MTTILNNFYIFQFFIEIFVMIEWASYFCAVIVTNDKFLKKCGVMKFFGRHALSSRGWRQQDKQSIEPLARETGIDHRTLYFG